MGLGLKLQEGGETTTILAVAVTDESLRTLAMAALVRQSSIGLSPYCFTLSLSRSGLKSGISFFFLFFSFLFFKFLRLMVVCE